MRVLFKLNAERDVAYDSEYHHKLRGVLWDYLSDTQYSELHGDSTTVPFVFSNPFPVKNYSQGDQANVIVASPHNGLVETLDEKVSGGDEFNIGELPFTVDHSTTFSASVGDIGESGVLRTSTGVYCPLPEERWEEYGVDVPYNTDKIGWTNEYSLGVFLDRMAENLSWKQDVLLGEYLDSPNGAGLFDDVSYQKGYAVTVPVTSEYEYTFVVSKWEFGYRVRNEDHRRWLNLLLDSGLGWRNSLGFGFVNKGESK